MSNLCCCGFKEFSSFFYFSQSEHFLHVALFLNALHAFLLTLHKLLPSILNEILCCVLYVAISHYFFFLFPFTDDMNFPMIFFKSKTFIFQHIPNIYPSTNRRIRFFTLRHSTCDGVLLGYWPGISTNGSAWKKSL